MDPLINFNIAGFMPSDLESAIPPPSPFSFCLSTNQSHREKKIKMKIIPLSIFLFP